MKRRITFASSPGWLKLIAWAAPSMTTTETWVSVWLATSSIRAGPGISGSRFPMTASVGIRSASNRSNDGYCVRARNIRKVLGTPKRR